MPGIELSNGDTKERKAHVCLHKLPMECGAQQINKDTCMNKALRVMVESMAVKVWDWWVLGSFGLDSKGTAHLRKRHFS